MFGTKKGRKFWHFRYVNGVPIKDGNKALHVNWCEVEVINASTKRYLSKLLATLILFSFSLHTLLRLTDTRYRATRKYFSRKHFFNQMRTLLIYLHFMTWASLMIMMLSAFEAPPTHKLK